MKKVRWFRCAALIIAIALLIVVVLLAGRRLAIERRYRQQAAAWRAQGYPESFDELDDLLPRPPDDANAALLFMKAFDYLDASLRPDPIPFDAIIDGEAAFTAEMAEELQQHVAANEEAIRLALEAAQRPEARWASRYIEFVSLLDNTDLLENLSKSRAMTRVLRDAAWFHAIQDDGEKTAEMLHAAFRLTHALDQIPDSTSFLVATACFDISMVTLEETLGQTTIPVSSLMMLDQAFDALESFEDPGYLFLGDALNAVHALSDDLHQHPGIGPFAYILRAYTLITGDHRAYLDSVYSDGMDMLHVASVPWPDRFGRMEERLDESPQQQPFLHFNFAGNWIALADRLARQRCTRVALAAERYRQEHGAWPRDLDRLTEMLPDEAFIDPFTGDRLGYEQDDDRVVVSSEGLSALPPYRWRAGYEGFLKRFHDNLQDSEYAPRTISFTVRPAELAGPHIAQLPERD